MPLGPPLIYLLKNCCLSTGLFDESYFSMIVRSAPSVEACPPEKPQGNLILGRPFSVVAESRLHVSPRHSPFCCRFQ